MDFILKLKSMEKVVDRYNSHLHPGMTVIIAEALAKIESLGRKFIIEEVNLGRIIGETICVVTGPDDEIVYAKRPKRFGLSRFVKNRQPEPSSNAVVILKAAEEDPGTYVLITAFIGGKPEPEPWDRNATSQSRIFWNSHALVWGKEEVIPGTETSVCPW